MRKLLILSIASLLMSCGSQDLIVSSPKSVGIPGLANSTNNLLWLQTDGFNYGECEKDRLPAVDTCVSRYVYSAQTFDKDFIAPLTATSIKAKADLNLEIKRLKDLHALVAPALTVLNGIKMQLDSEKIKLSTNQTAIQDLNQRLASDQKMIGDYEADIADIKTRIMAEPGNTRLVNLLSVLQSEKESLATKIVSNRTLLEARNQEKTDTSNRISDLDRQRIDAETNYLIKFNSVSVESEGSISLTKQAASADLELAAFQAIGDLARDGISYRQTLLSIAEKKALASLLVQILGFEIRANNQLFYRVGLQWFAVDSNTMTASIGEVICRGLGRTYRSISSISNGNQTMQQLSSSCQGKEGTPKSCSNFSNTQVSGYYGASLTCDLI